MRSWRELLEYLKARGLAVAPEIAVGDGALGFWKALEDIFPKTRHQRCWLRKVANVLNKLPKSVQRTMKAALAEIRDAPTGRAPRPPSPSSSRSTPPSMPRQSSV